VTYAHSVPLTPVIRTGILACAFRSQFEGGAPFVSFLLLSATAAFSVEPSTTAIPSHYCYYFHLPVYYSTPAMLVKLPLEKIFIS